MDFIVVGGVAAVLQGAPIMTLDLDLVHSREPANIDRLLAALEGLETRYRFRPELKPGRSHLSSAGHQLLITRYGPLDLLGAIGKGSGYNELLPRSIAMKVSGHTLRVLELAALIEIKEETADEKDRAVLPILRRTLEEKRQARRPILPPAP